MKITIERTWKKADYTIGRLYVNGYPFCDTLEPVDRGLRQTMSADYILKVKKLFKAGKTAIPAGRYAVRNIWSPRLKKVLPRLLDVPAFDGILIHQGNTVKNTAGCILVGENTERGKVLNSRKTLFRLQEMIAKAERGDDPVLIDIKE